MINRPAGRQAAVPASSTSIHTGCAAGISGAMPAGRPTKFKADFVEQVRKLCELGATDMELADFFGVDTRTIYRWRIEHPEFCQAAIVGKESADDRVERALYQRAVGYSFESEKVFHNQGEVVRTPITEHCPPDPSAAMNWLKNRRGDKWRDKQEIAVTTDETTAALLEAARRRAKGG